MNAKLHVSLDVKNVEESVRFYSAVFNTEPTKLKKGYAKFDLEKPGVVLAMQQNDPGKLQGLNHMGIRVDSTQDVLAIRDRLNAAGIKTADEMGTTCCYAVQDKIWLSDPTGYKWEVYVFHGDAEKMGGTTVQVPGHEATVCCAPEAKAAAGKDASCGCNKPAAERTQQEEATVCCAK